MQLSLCSVTSKLGTMFFRDRTFVLFIGPKLGDRPILTIGQGGTAKAAFDAINGTIDSRTETVVFSHCKPNPCGEKAKEQRHTNYNFIYSRGRDLRPLNNGSILARWVSLHAGTDVTRR